ASGTATITVTVSDNGGTANGGVNTFTPRFTVTVTPVNQPPTLHPVGDVTIFENGAPRLVRHRSTTARPGDTQRHALPAVRNNPSLIPNPTINYISPSTTGTLVIPPVKFQTGTAIITVNVTDSGDTSNGGRNTLITPVQFMVTVLPVNQPPRIDGVNNVTTL